MQATLAPKPKPLSRRERKKAKKNKSLPWKDCVVYVSGGDALDFATQFLDFSLQRAAKAPEGPTSVDPLPCEVHAFLPGEQVRSRSRQPERPELVVLTRGV